MAVIENHGRDHFMEIGERVGAAVRERQGVEFFAEIGQNGGSSRKGKRRQEKP